MSVNSQLKASARQRIQRGDVPSVLKVTLVFLILGSLIPDVINAVIIGPQTELRDALNQAALTMDYNVVTGVTTRYVASTAGMVGMFFSIFLALYSAVLNVGYTFYCMKIVRNIPDSDYNDLSYGLNMVTKIIILCIRICIRVFLWSLLFVIPGIIAGYRYSMSCYALLEDPSISTGEALNRSGMMMNGHKLDLFVMDLSFIGWLILAGICTSIGASIGTVVIGNQLVASILGFITGAPLLVWLTAYMKLAQTYFYEYVSGHGMPNVNAPNRRPYDSMHSSQDNSPWN